MMKIKAIKYIFWVLAIEDRTDFDWNRMELQDKILHDFYNLFLKSENFGKIIIPNKEDGYGLYNPKEHFDLKPEEPYLIIDKIADVEIEKVDEATSVGNYSVLYVTTPNSNLTEDYLKYKHWVKQEEVDLAENQSHSTVEDSDLLEILKCLTEVGIENGNRFYAFSHDTRYFYEIIILE